MMNIEAIDLREAAAFIAGQMRRFGARGSDEELAAFAQRALAADIAYMRDVGADEEPDAYDEDDACEAILAALEDEDDATDEQAMQTRLLLLNAFMEAEALWREQEEDE